MMSAGCRLKPRKLIGCAPSIRCCRWLKPRGWLRQKPPAWRCRAAPVLQLAAGALSGGDALQEALKITRLLLDFRLPEGIKSRQILQQMQSFQTA